MQTATDTTMTDREIIEQMLAAKHVEPLPSGEIATAVNPEDMEISLRYRYTEDRDGGLYYFITYDNIFVKGFAHQGMAMAVHHALSKTWKKEYRTLIPRVCDAFRKLFPNEQEPTDEQLDIILGQALMRGFGRR